MHRRQLLRLALGTVAAGSVAACGPQRTSATAAPSPSASVGASASPRVAVAGDYRWFATNTDLSKGFSFIWVKKLTSQQVIDGLGAKELERIFWRQMVGAGDGQRGATDQLYFGVSRIDPQWALVVEDNGVLGTTEPMLRRLSRDTTVISHYRAADGRGRLLMFTDGSVDLDLDPLTEPPRRGLRTSDLAPLMSAVGFGRSTDPAYCAAAAFALTERLTGVAMTEDLLREKTYLLSTAPRP